MNHTSYEITDKQIEAIFADFHYYVDNAKRNEEKGDAEMAMYYRTKANAYTQVIEILGIEDFDPYYAVYGVDHMAVN